MTQLKHSKKELAVEETRLLSGILQSKINKNKVIDSCHAKFFFGTSFEDYEYNAGLSDYGPAGIGIKQNIEKVFRRSFINQSKINSEEIEATILTPDPVFEASGHKVRFCDYVVKENKNGKTHRLDHLLEKLEGQSKKPQSRKNIDSMSVGEQYALLEKLKGPGKFSAPIEYNLMFKTNFGEKNHIFLRPETAQGMFMNFRRMRDFNGHKLPFAVGQIGKSFRNELQTSSQAMQRLREFNMAELQVFFDPEKLVEIEPEFEPSKCLVWSASDQMSGKTASVRSLTDTDVNGNKIYLYYLQKVMNFAETIGLDLTKCRLRQHSDYEMAHYSTDCWDLEVEMFDNSWSECVGIANRGCYDLTNHGEKSGAVHNYTAERTRDSDGKVVRYVPHVIEPSFGLDRLVMAVLVHNFKERKAVTVKSVVIGSGKCDSLQCLIDLPHFILFFFSRGCFSVTNSSVCCQLKN